MNNTRAMAAEMKEVETMQVLALVYAEIASNRMRKTRGKVLHNRDFLTAINEIFQEVHDSYAKQLASLLKQRLNKTGRITMLAHNGKHVAIFLSANTGLFGDIIDKTFEKFLSDVTTSNAEVTIIGKLGLSLFQSSAPGKPYTYFELPDQEVGENDMGAIIRHIVQYEKISVYYGKFESVISQKPSVFEISAQSPYSAVTSSAKTQVQYIFEPSIEKILIFFESEIFSSLFSQAVRESQLAKFASRILAMDKASENIKDYLHKMNVDFIRAKHQHANSKQLNAFPYHLFSH